MTASLLIIAGLALVAIVTIPVSVYFISRRLIDLGAQHAAQLEAAYARGREEVGEMNDRLMEMVNVQHWTSGTLQELGREQASAFDSPKPPIEMDEEEEDEWARNTWGHAELVAEDVGADIADVLGAAGVELEVDGASN